jgi:hypothetical protein
MKDYDVSWAEEDLLCEDEPDAGWHQRIEDDALI